MHTAAMNGSRQSTRLVLHLVQHLLPLLSRHNCVGLHQLQHLLVFLLNRIHMSVCIRGPRLDLPPSNGLGGIACHDGTRLDILSKKETS